MTDLPDIEGVLFEQHRSALFVTLNRPQAKNALTAIMVAGLISSCDWLEDHREIRMVVLRGAGGAFCAGGDIKEFGRTLMTPEPAAGEADPVVSANRQFGELLLRLDAIPQMLLTVIEGPCFGGANGLACVSDVIIAEAHARFSLSETTLGIPPAQIGPFLVRRIGLYNARRLALTGAQFGASEAMQMGLISAIADGVDGVEKSIAEVLNAAGRCEGEANAVTKALLNRAAPAIDPAALDRAAAEFAACLRAKGREGAMAFANKSAPAWVESFVVTKEA